ncbi:AcrR family transcriptional regulator [Streptomyces albaduncus]|uniref:AcrR family transcriptional regulator n=2 Tax=Streptomyces griseoloalbus TaxID=67303 RepID=A0A7W8BRJ0_9ACTN|nr:AcrR family transcriptional regulator [Streptomyces albaduncus]GGV82669.1 TetR family transcriptional regulator [Streptomyces griseoloalbus]GGW54421.1 TetR family transcriptional regulator [Streptomyces albaduncus]
MTGKNIASGGLRERKKRATRAALAEAAVRLAAEQGADNVTVEAISAAAGVSVRTFFNYFDSRDDAFVVIDADVGIRVRQALLDAPAALSPLEALREALAVELSEAERQHELWSLHAEVLRTSPHLLVRSLGAHMADEAGLAEVIARRLAGGATDDDAVVPPDDGSGREQRPALDLYPRLLAALAGTAVRVSAQHWCDRQDELAFADVFREVFALLAAGLPAPAR